MLSPEGRILSPVRPSVGRGTLGVVHVSGSRLERTRDDSTILIIEDDLPVHRRSTPVRETTVERRVTSGC